MPIIQDVLSALPLGLGMLSVFMTVDILLALICASMDGTAWSKPLKNGASLKAGILLLVFLTFLVNSVVQVYIPEARQYIPVNIGKIVTLWFIIGEMISIAEHAHTLGIPLPKFLVNALKVARAKMDIQIPSFKVETIQAETVTAKDVTTQDVHISDASKDN